MNAAELRAGEFALPESPEGGRRGLAVRPVTEEDKKDVRRCGGYLLGTTAEAEAFAPPEVLFGPNAPPWARGSFAHKRVDGLRIYVGLGIGGI